MKLNYITPMLQINAFSAEDLIRTSGEAVIPERVKFAIGEQGAKEQLEDYIRS